MCHTKLGGKTPSERHGACNRHPDDTITKYKSRFATGDCQSDVLTLQNHINLHAQIPYTTFCTMILIVMSEMPWLADDRLLTT